MADQVLTKQKLINGDQDLSDLEEVLSGPPGKLIKTRLGREVYTLASVPQINTMTREEVTSAVEPKANKADVDTALELKAPQATTYTKMEVDALTTPKADKDYVDNIVSAAANGVIPFQTQAELLLAKPTQVKVLAKAMDTRKEYLWNRTSAEGVTPVVGTWIDTGLSDFDQAKTYFDGSVTTKNSVELYSASNNVVNLNVDPANGSLRVVSLAQVNVFPITAGKVYTLNSVGFNTTYAKLAVSPNNSTTVGKTQTLVALTSGGDANTKTFVAPITGYAFLNAKWVPSLDMTTTLSIKSNEFDVVVSLKDHQIRDELAQQRLNDAHIETVLNELDLTIVIPDIYTVGVKTAGFFVGVSGTIVSNSGGELVSFPILPNKTYLIKAPQFLSTKTVGLSSTNTVVNGKAITNRALSATTDADVYSFTTTEADASLLFAFFTTRIDSQSYDVRNSVEIFEGAVPSDKNPYISSIKGVRLQTQTEVPQVKIETRLSNKKMFALGDSITAGTNGSYIPQLESLLGTTINNYGSSGGRASRVVDIITAGAGMPKRDSATSSTVWPTKDFTDLACVTLMIGTNDSDANISTMGSIDQLPLGKVQDHANPNDYWALFPNNYVCNIALFIEYIRWKAPQAEIHICTPPYRNQTGVSDETRITKLIPLLESVARLYSVHLIYGTYECGIGYKHMSAEYGIYSPDGVHFTQLGNEIFGKFFAQKVLSFG